MTITNEPGYYETNEFGIRIETILLIQPYLKGYSKPQQNWLHFENITVFPLDFNLLDCEILTKTEKQWFNAYQKRCLEELTPILDESTAIWLKNYIRFIEV
eukprot:NODE_157_length_15108_cov_0.423079.p15 type:complete len:101 gc:universal NODE_157_length_15108_cov_0.423079:637-335(-)